jgi:hypothetical protein
MIDMMTERRNRSSRLSANPRMIGSRPWSSAS